MAVEADNPTFQVGFILGVEKGRESTIRIMSEVGVKEAEGLQMIKVTSEQARKWGEELREVVGARERWLGREPFATMESETDSGARELLHGFEIGVRDYDPELGQKVFVDNNRSLIRNLRLEEGLGHGAPSLAGAWEGEVEIPVLGVYGLGVRLGGTYLAEKSSPDYHGGLGSISAEQGLMGEYRKQLVEGKNPELLKVLDAVLVGIKRKGKKNG